MKNTVFLFLFFISFGFSQTDSTNYYRNRVLYPEMHSDLAKAYLYFERQAANYLKVQDTLAYISAMRLLAITQFSLGLTHESEQTTVSALKVIEIADTKFIPHKIGLYNQLGKVYRNLSDYNQALYFYDEALKLASKKDRIALLNNKANTLREQGDLKQAETIYKMVFSDLEKKQDTLLKARILDNLGFVQSKLNKPEAEKYLFSALRFRQAHNDLKGLFSSYRHLSLHYLDKNDKDKARFYAQACYTTAKQLNSLSFLKEALGLQVRLKNDTTIFEYQKIIDSVQKIERQEQNKFAALKYNITLEKQNTQKVKLQQEKEKRQKIAVYYIASGIAVMSAFLLFYFKEKHKKEKVKEVLKTEMRISKTIHDEIANDVYQTMVSVESNKVPKEKIMDHLENIYNKTRDISKANSAINTQDFTTELKNLFKNYSTNKVNIIINGIEKINWGKYSALHKQTLYRVLQELLTNMRKHSNASLVILTFTQEGKNLTILYKDNGVGWKGNTGNGLENAGNRMESIGGSLTFGLQKPFKTSQTSGFEVTIKI